ncbi:MAG: hypothetical protein LKF82_13730 [Acinetobacter populi]|jgi:hypothetical protein|uniref:hypothetical protein n=1 Tax=Acinetobacter populi TaxID=1582270 RepID=UPI00235760A3|nr:hypothetical protein [Acinetobacter populi]MCH4248866.1 hypothetical protein [Acinetobacter populi]
MTEQYNYVVAELRPCTDQDEYTDIVINNEFYIIHRLDACKDLNTAMYTAIDIERTQPSHKHLTLHHESLLKLIEGINGDYEPQPQREVFKLMALAKAQGVDHE